MLEAIKKSPVQFEVGEVDRTAAKQAQYVAAGASTTMNSRHIAKVPAHPWYGKEPVSHAVDVVCYVGKAVRWDWPLYRQVGAHIKAVANKLGIEIVWGGDWKSFPDGPHFELHRKTYP